MKKVLGIVVIFMGCVISAVDIVRMLNGLAYGWDCILGGFIMAVASWLFLMDSDHSLLQNIAKTAACIVVIMAISLFTGDNNAPSTSQNGRTNTNNNSGSNYYRYDDNDYVHDYGDYEERTCFYCYGSGDCDTCGGSGRYSYTASSTRGDRCPTCEGSGKCHGCNGRGTR